MSYYVGLDVSVKSVSICVVEADGAVTRIRGDRLQHLYRRVELSEVDLKPETRKNKHFKISSRHSAYRKTSRRLADD